jgi:hypothetical protein
MKASIKDGILTLQIPVNQTPELSKSGKSRIVATSGGNMTLSDVKVDGKPLVVGFNAYIKN